MGNSRESGSRNEAAAQAMGESYSQDNYTDPFDYDTERAAYDKGIKSQEGFERPPGSHCDEYGVGVAKGADRLPSNYPDPISHTVAPKPGSTAPTYTGKLAGDLQDTPNPGINAVLMSGGDFPDKPHYVTIFKNENGSIDYTHYTGDKIFTWNDRRANTAGFEGGFGYATFQYYPLSGR